MKIELKWYTSVLKKYAVFSGRARRREFWTFTIINILITLILIYINSFVIAFIEGFIEGFVEGFLSAQNGDVQDTSGIVNFGIFGVVFIPAVYFLLLLIPSLAVMVRRFHDTGHRAWWIVLHIISILFVGYGGLIALGIILDTIPADTPIVNLLISVLLIGAIPGIIILNFLLQDSQIGENHYGTNPKAKEVSEGKSS